MDEPVVGAFWKIDRFKSFLWAFQPRQFVLKIIGKFSEAFRIKMFVFFNYF